MRALVGYLQNSRIAGFRTEIDAARTLVYEAPAIEADPARVRALFNTNVFGLMEVTTAFTPLLLASVSSDFCR